MKMMIGKKNADSIRAFPDWERLLLRATPANEPLIVMDSIPILYSVRRGVPPPLEHWFASLLTVK